MLAVSDEGDILPHAILCMAGCVLAEVLTRVLCEPEYSFTVAEEGDCS